VPGNHAAECRDEQPTLEPRSEAEERLDRLPGAGKAGNDAVVAGDHGHREDAQARCTRERPSGERPRIEADEKPPGDQRQRREHGPDVGRELGARRAEEQEDEGRPCECKTNPREAERVRRSVTPRVPRAEGEYRQPGQAADCEQRHVIPPGSGAAVAGREIAVDVLVDEEELQELGVGT